MELAQLQMGNPIKEYLDTTATLQKLAAGQEELSQAPLRKRSAENALKLQDLAVQKGTAEQDRQEREDLAKAALYASMQPTTEGQKQAWEQVRSVYSQQGYDLPEFTGDPSFFKGFALLGSDATLKQGYEMLQQQKSQSALSGMSANLSGQEKQIFDTLLQSDPSGKEANQFLSEIYKGNQRLIAEGFTPGTPEAFRRARELNNKSGVSINITPEGAIPLDKPTTTEAQKRIVSAGESLARLKKIKQDYDPKFLTYQGKVSNFISGLKSKASADLTKEEKEFLQQERKFKQNVNYEFNNYRREITGAAAALAELESLKKAAINTDLSPAEFEASFDEYSSELSRTVRIRNKLLREGILPGTKQFGESLDQLYISGDDDSIEARGDELEQQGMPPEQIKGALKAEGYY